MPVRGTCLLHDTPLKEALFDIVGFTAYERLRNGKSASVEMIYSDLRKAGIEVDLPTVGEIYNETLPRDDANFDSEIDIDDKVLKTWNDAINNLIPQETEEGEEQQQEPVITGEEQIGQQKPESQLVEFILNAVFSDVAINQRTKSDMKAMQDALWKGMQRLLGPRKTEKAQDKKTMKELIQQSLDWEKLGIRDVNGRLNNITDLFNAMRGELQKAAAMLEDAAYPIAQERFNEYVKNLENASYKLLFSKKDALQVRNDALIAGGYGKKLKNGETILDWNKLAADVGDVNKIRENADKAFEDAGFGQDVIERLKDSLEQEFYDLRAEIMEKSQKDLANRAAAKERGGTPKKSDLKRLVELYHLGVFKSSHDKLMYDLLGVDKLQQKDLEDIENLSKAASDLSRRVVDVNGYNLTDDVFVARRLQYIQRHIDNIVERNIKDKSKTLSIIKAIANFVDLMLTGLLSLPITMVQNIFSGAKSVLTGVRFNGTKEKIIEDGGKFYIQHPLGRSPAYDTKKEAEEHIIDLTGKTKQSLELYWSMLKEVSLTGQAYGEEIGSFATRELFANTLRWKWGEGLLGKGATLKDKAKSVLFALTLPSRIGLLAFDSANKVSLTNKTFYNMVYNSLVKRDIPPEQAVQFMNEALYGQKFEDAKKLAEKIIKDSNELLKPELRSKGTKSEIVTLANDIVKANLNLQGSIVETNVLEAALKGSYHVAGLGLGHEPNNILSRGVKGLRDSMKRDEDRLVKEKDWHGLASHRIKSLAVNGFMLRFIGGATNWLLLRAKEGLGLGLITGGYGLAMNNQIDFARTDSLQRQMKEREKARNDIARSMVGVAYTALAYAIGAAVVGGSDDDDEEKLKRLQAKKTKTDADKNHIEELKLKTSAYARIKQNSSQDRWFRTLAPDAMLVQYYGQDDTGFLPSLAKYTNRVYYGSDRFSVGQKIEDAITLYNQGDKQGGDGTLMSIIGDRVQVPFWRASKEYYRMITNPFRSEQIPPSKYEAPTTWDEGLIGSGALQDLGIYKKDSRITLVPGVGAKSYEKFKKNGIENMSDLKDGWWNKKDSGQYILDADERKKAKKFYEEYKKTK